MKRPQPANTDLVIAKKLDSTAIINALKQRRDVSRFIGTALEELNYNPALYIPSRRILDRLDNVADLSEEELRIKYNTTLRANEAAEYAIQMHCRHLLALAGYLDLTSDNNNPNRAVSEELRKSEEALERACEEARILERLRLDSPISSHALEATQPVLPDIVSILRHTGQIIGREVQMQQTETVMN